MKHFYMLGALLLAGFSADAHAGQLMKTMGCLGLYQPADGSNQTHYWGSAYPLEGYIVARPTHTIYIKSIHVRASTNDAARGYIQVYKMPGNQMIAGIIGGTTQEYVSYEPDAFELRPSDHLEFFVSYSGGGRKFVQAWCHYTDAP